MSEPILIPIVEPVKLPPYSSNFCDLWMWAPPIEAGGEIDFHNGDRIYAVDSTGKVVGGIYRPKRNSVQFCYDPGWGYGWAAMLHVYGPIDVVGSELFLLWSGSNFGFLNTEQPLKFERWTSKRFVPILPGE